MKTIAVIYHPVDYNQVEQLKSLLTEKKLESRSIQIFLNFGSDCWIIFKISVIFC